MALITINGVSIDPLKQPQGLRSLESEDAAGSNYILIQTQGPLGEEQKQQLAGAGVEIQEYVPENTYLCHYGPTDLAPVRELPFVLWANVYMRGFKLAQSLRAAEPQGVQALKAAPETGWPADQKRQVDVVVHDDVDPRATGKEIAAAADVPADAVEAGRGKVRLAVDEDQLEALTQLDAVHHVEAVPERKLFNNVARTIVNAEVALDGVDYKGEGEVICVADTGFDTGSTTNVHPAFSGRVTRLYALGRTNPDKTDDPHSHGTHVAGSVLGDGNSSTMGGAIQGTAPAAHLVLQSTLDSSRGLGGIPADLHDLFVPPYEDDGARVHTNSWGATQPSIPYDQSATEIDEVVWDRQDLVICFAAGNDGSDGDRNGRVDPSSIGSQSAAKNCITVGASESLRPKIPLTYGELGFPVDPISSDLTASDADGLGAFSSRGPTPEGRIKPDVVAPGTSILSTLSRAVAHPSTTFGTSSDKLFFFDTGTSMATPLVAGCVAVLRETLRKNGSPSPSAALIKALLINGAVELAGQYNPTEAGPSPNNDSGFGRVDLAGSVIVAGDDPDSGFGEGGPLKQGEEETFTVDIPERKGDHHEQGVGGLTFKVTLVWSDPAGAALQNDLDLIVEASDGEERHGNMGSGDGFDRANNVEQVLWEGMPPGKAKVTVRAHRITRFSQPYSYAWRLSG